MHETFINTRGELELRNLSQYYLCVFSPPFKKKNKKKTLGTLLDCLVNINLRLVFFIDGRLEQFCVAPCCPYSRDGQGADCCIHRAQKQGSGNGHEYTIFRMDFFTSTEYCCFTLFRGLLFPDSSRRSRFSVSRAYQRRGRAMD